MSYIKNTLNFASYAYNAGTNTPSLTTMKDGVIYEVSTAGQLTGTSIEGAQVGADSYLLVGDKVVRKNGGYELLSREVKDNTNITIGAGGLFSDFYTSNEYTKQRIYSNLSLTLLSSTAEASAVDVTNSCEGKLSILGNGFTIDFSGTVGTNCTLSGDNIYVDNFKVKANILVGGALTVKGKITTNNGISSTCTNSGGYAIVNYGSISGIIDPTTTLAAATANLFCVNSSGVANGAYAGNNGILNIYNLTSSGIVNLGNSCSNYISGAITTGGGMFYGGAACSNTIIGAITTGGGQFYGGAACSHYISGAITTGGGMFHGGTACSNTIIGAITTGGGMFYGGAACSNTIDGAITTGGGPFHGGSNCQTCVSNTITGVGAAFTFVYGTKLYVSGTISGYTIAGTQFGIGVYDAATSAGVLRNQNTNTLQAN